MAEKKGIIDISGLLTPPEKHELMTAQFFANMGKNVSFIRPSSIPEVYRPDILMDGVEWEIKSPIGCGKKTIERNFRKAAMQSKFVIFDLRRIGIDEDKCISKLEREFEKRGIIKRILIIKKDGTLLEIPKKA